jgi:arylsulfatase A-like enzyme
MKKAGRTPDEMSIAEHDKIIDLYDSDLRYCSTHVERLFDSLQELNIWDDIDIVFTSDHGEEFYEHGEYFHRNLPYDELLHVPLIVRLPKTSTQEDITEQRELIDVAPTILDFHGVEKPTGFEGQNLFSGNSRDVIATGCQQQKPPVVAGRWDGYKYISTPDGEYLFDLSTNAFEDNNISAANESLCQQYRGAIPRQYFSEDLDEKLREPDDEVDRERLEALGYLEIDD